MPVIGINIIGFEYGPLEEYHTSYHLWEDRHKDTQLTDVCEIHFLDMVKFRRARERNLGIPLNRWLTYFDEHSPKELVEEVIRMDSAIQLVQDNMDLIVRDPALFRAYESLEKAERDYNNGIEGARREGLQKGVKEGRKAGAKEVIDLLTQGIPIEEVRKILDIE